jgi:hypothetical protein
VPDSREETNMNEIRLTIIKNHEDPTKDKRVEIHVTDADAVLASIKDKPDHQFKALAGELTFLVTTVLAKCGDTDKIEIGIDEDGKPNPTSAFHHKGDGSGEKVAFSL